MKGLPDFDKVHKLATLVPFVLLCFAAETQDGFTPLFNGTDLTGWSGDKRFWRVEDGAIAGSTDAQPSELNTFLVHERKFSNFHLKADVKLRNGNSGIQFRSTHLPGPGWIVYGYQADVSDKDQSWGNFYEERGRGRKVMLSPDEGWRKAKDVVRRGEWNEVEVIANGSEITLLLNGVITYQGQDKLSSEGVIALQLHSGQPMRVEYRNIRIKPI